jgi:hypothetical protein
MHFRPGDLPQGDPTAPNEPVEWADNPVSNLLAYLSTTITPRWCQAPEHWTSRLTAYLFSDCPCCLLFRGIVIGVLATFTFTFIVALFAAAWLTRTP